MLRKIEKPNIYVRGNCLHVKINAISVSFLSLLEMEIDVEIGGMEL